MAGTYLTISLLVYPIWPASVIFIPESSGWTCTLPWGTFNFLPKIYIFTMDAKTLQQINTTSLEDSLPDLSLRPACSQNLIMSSRYTIHHPSSIHLLFIYPPSTIHPSSILPSIIYLSIYWSSHPSSTQSSIIDLSTIYHLSIHLSIHPSIHHPIIHHLSIHPSIYPSSQ